MRQPHSIFIVRTAVAGREDRKRQTLTRVCCLGLGLNLPAEPARAALAHCGQQHPPFLWQEHSVAKLSWVPWPDVTAFLTEQTQSCSSWSKAPKDPQHRAVLRARLTGTITLHYFEAMVQVNTYDKAGGCFQKNVLMPKSSALTSQFRPLINQL